MEPERLSLRVDEAPVRWPWIKEPFRLPREMPDGRTWPRISIVTPSLNQGKFIEETIRSVLMQGYPEVEYIIIDGGSTDNSLDIIKKYASQLAFWASEKDAGQSDAINKGFARATGRIMAYINSDDYYLPGAFVAAAEAIASRGLPWLVADAIQIEEGKPGESFLRAVPPVDWIDMATRHARVPQPSTFWRSQLWRECGRLDPQMYFSFDWDLYCRFLLKNYIPFYCEKPISVLRYHASTKTTLNSEHMALDDEIIWQRCLAACSRKDWIRGQFEYKRRFSPRFRFWSDPENWARVFWRKVTGQS